MLVTIRITIPIRESVLDHDPDPGRTVTLSMVAFGGGLCSLSTSSCVVLCSVHLPPSIVQSPMKEKIYRPYSEVQLDCVAEGTPEPTYCTVIYV